MDDSAESSLAALMPVIIFSAVVLSAFIFWCFLSSCMGTPLRRSLSNLWEYTVISARMSQRGPARRRGPYVEDEIWEMQSRGRGRDF